MVGDDELDVMDATVVEALYQLQAPPLFASAPEGVDEKGDAQVAQLLPVIVHATRQRIV